VSLNKISINQLSHILPFFHQVDRNELAKVRVGTLLSDKFPTQNGL